jgi:hypothetical protein
MVEVLVYSEQNFFPVPSVTTFSGGPFCEVQLLVDGQVSWAAYPYAMIFTGGIVV